MLQLKDFMPVNFLKKEKYTGSCKGMRFRMEKFEKEGADAPILRVSVWPEPCLLYTSLLCCPILPREAQSMLM